MDLPISDDLTIALWYLVFGVGLASAAIGVEMTTTGGTDSHAERELSSTAAD